MTETEPDRLADAISIEDGGSPVTITKLVSKRGERLQIVSGADRIKLDALILESLSWQRSLEALAAVVDDGDPIRTDETPISGGEPIANSPTIRISNEYAQVSCTHVRTATGEALALQAPARGSSITLGPPTLRALAAHTDTVAFSEFFKTPVGPEDTRLEGPH